MNRYIFVRCILVAVASISHVHAQSVEEEDYEVIEPSKTNPTKLGKADVSKVEKMIIQKTNSLRKDHDLNTVEADAELDKAAEYFANYMAKKDKYGHNADGNSPAQRAKKFDYKYCLVLENISYQYSTNDFATDKLAQKFFHGWKTSPGHRKNMLDPDVTETAVAVVQSKESGFYYAVQMFGRPKTKKIEFSLFNKSPTSVKYKVGKRSFELPSRYRRTHTVCRPPHIKVSSGTKKSGWGKNIQPSDGTRYIVEQGPSGELQMKKTTD